MQLTILRRRPKQRRPARGPEAAAAVDLLRRCRYPPVCLLGSARLRRRGPPPVVGLRHRVLLRRRWAAALRLAAATAGLWR